MYMSAWAQLLAPRAQAPRALTSKQPALDSAICMHARAGLGLGGGGRWLHALCSTPLATSSGRLFPSSGLLRAAAQLAALQHAVAENAEFSYVGCMPDGTERDLEYQGARAHAAAPPVLCSTMLAPE